jgi:predicted amidophosphoribosyltransferase
MRCGALRGTTLGLRYTTTPKRSPRPMARCGTVGRPQAPPCAACLARSGAARRTASGAAYALLEAKFRGVTTLLPRYCVAGPYRRRRLSLVVPVPLHRTTADARLQPGRHCRRVVAGCLGVRIAARRCAARATAPQATLDAARRALNVVAAFAASGVVGERVLVVDDIPTTGPRSMLRPRAARCRRRGGLRAAAPRD